MLFSDTCYFRTRGLIRPTAGLKRGKKGEENAGKRNKQGRVDLAPHEVGVLSTLHDVVDGGQKLFVLPHIKFGAVRHTQEQASGCQHLRRGARHRDGSHLSRELRELKPVSKEIEHDCSTQLHRVSQLGTIAATLEPPGTGGWISP